MTILPLRPPPLSLFKQQRKTLLCSYLTKLKLGEHFPCCHVFFLSHYSLLFQLLTVILIFAPAFWAPLCSPICSALCYFFPVSFPSIVYPLDKVLVVLQDICLLGTFKVSIEQHPFSPQYKHTLIHLNAASSSSVHSAWDCHMWP